MVLKTSVVKEPLLLPVPSFYQFWGVLRDQIGARFLVEPASLAQLIEL